MEKQIRQGNMNPGISTRPLGDGLIEFRHANGGRIIVRERPNNVVEVLGKSGKKQSTQDFVIGRAKKVFPNNEPKGTKGKR